MNALCTRWPVAAIMAAAVFAVVPSGQGLAAGTAQDPVRAEAEALARAASQEFGAILDRQRVAQASTGGAPERAEPKAAADEPGGAWGWLQRSRHQFQALMQLLAGGRSPPSNAADQPAPRTAATAGAAVTATPADRPSEPSPRPGAAVPTTPETKPAATAAKATEGKDKAPGAKQVAETKTAQADTKKPDAPKSDAPKSAPKSEPPKSDGKAATPKAGEPKPDAPKGAAPKSEPGKPDTKATAPKAGEPTGAAQGKPPAKPDGTAGTPPPAGPPPATREAAPGGIADEPVAKTARKRTRHATARSPRHRTAARSCRAAGRTIRAPGWYVVRKGDTLSAIARRHYGSGRLYTRIRAANRGRIRSADRIYACQRIYLPRMGRRR